MDTYPCHNDRFIAAESTTRAQDFAPAVRRSAGSPPVSIDVREVLLRYERWEALTPGQQAKLLRDSGIWVARSAGLSFGQIASAIDLSKSQVQQIVGGASA